MTQPVQEPNPNRDLSGLGWGERQLARRPAPPSGSCPCPLDSAIAYDSASGGGTGTVDDNSLTEIIFDQFSISSGSVAFAEDQGAVTTRPFKCIIDGWYLAYINFEWSGGVYADVRTYAFYTNTLADNCGNQNVIQSASSPYIDSAFNGTFGPFYIRGHLSGSYFKTKVQHHQGSQQTVTGVAMTVVYLGDDIDPARFPPF